MPNWCSNYHYVVGPLEDVNRFIKTINNACSGKWKESINTDFSEYWLGNILLELNIYPDKVKRGEELPGAISYRGSICDLPEDPDPNPKNKKEVTTSFMTETAWGPSEMWDDLIFPKYFPTLQHYFVAEEPGCEVYINTDESRTYLLDDYMLIINSDMSKEAFEDYCSMYFKKPEHVNSFTELFLDCDNFGEHRFAAGELEPFIKSISHPNYPIESITDFELFLPTINDNPDKALSIRLHKYLTR